MGAIFRFFEGLLDPFQPYDETKTPPGTLGAFFRAFLGPARGVVATIFVFGGLFAIIDALIINISADIINTLNQADKDQTYANFWELYGYDLIFVGLLVVAARPLAVIIERMLSGQTYWLNMVTLMRWRTHRYLLRQSVGFFHDDFAGRIANKQMQLAPSFNDVIIQLLDAVWYAFAFLVASAIFVSFDSPMLLIPLGVWFALYVVAASFFVPRIAARGKELSEARSRLSGRIVDSYTNIQTVKLFAHTAREEAYAREAIDDWRWHLTRQERIITGLVMTLTTLNAVLLAGLVGGGMYLWSVDAASIGAVAAAVTLGFRLQGMTEWIMWTLTQIFQNIGTVMEGMELVSQPIRLPDAPDAKPLKVTEARIRFENVAHRYGRPKGETGFRGVEDVTLEIQPGERVGLVGRSGAGKSTLMNALLRFFDVDGGRILIDGQDIRRGTQESLRAQIGMVTQDTSLLHRSILDNILYGARDGAFGGDQNAARKAVEEAARRVSAHEFITELEDKDGRTGYDAYVGERGVKLSGGQRQRIALARVALKNAPVLVLDEATSALDSEVEAAILEAMKDLMEGKTVIAIAHRLSTIAQMDRIVVLDAGRIIEQGDHEALLRQGGVYANLWSRQSGGFLDLEAPADVASAGDAAQ